MVLPSEKSEQIAFNTRPKLEQHLLMVMDKSIHEQHLSIPLQSNNKRFKIAITILTGYRGIFNVTNKNKKFHFTISIIDDNFNPITIPPEAYELESLHEEFKRNIIKDGCFTEGNYPFIIKLNFSTLGGIIEIESKFIGTQNGFVHDDCIRDLLGFDSVVSYEKYNSSQNPVDLLTNFFLNVISVKE